MFGVLVRSVLARAKVVVESFSRVLWLLAAMLETDDTPIFVKCECSGVLLVCV